jgi:hypothetical protein
MRDSDRRAHGGGDRKGSKDRKSDRSLSYSPARRNPERYKEILDAKTKSNEKAKKQVTAAGPVVKLHSTSSDRESSDNEESSSKVDDFMSIDKNQDKELNRLKALKSELAAKAKESLEKKIISEAASTSSSQRMEHMSDNRKFEKSREMQIAQASVSAREKQDRDEKKVVVVSKVVEPAKKESASREVIVPPRVRKSRSPSKTSRR